MKFMVVEDVAIDVVYFNQVFELLFKGGCQNEFRLIYHDINQKLVLD